VGLKTFKEYGAIIVTTFKMCFCDEDEKCLYEINYHELLKMQGISNLQKVSYYTTIPPYAVEKCRQHFREIAPYQNYEEDYWKNVYMEFIKNFLVIVNHYSSLLYTIEALDDPFDEFSAYFATRYVPYKLEREHGYKTSIVGNGENNEYVITVRSRPSSSPQQIPYQKGKHSTTNVGGKTFNMRFNFQ